MGIEPTALAWEARVLPLYDARRGTPGNAITAVGRRAAPSHGERRRLRGPASTAPGFGARLPRSVSPVRTFLTFRASPIACLCIIKHTGWYTVLAQCVARTPTLGEPLAATARNDRHIHGSTPGSSTSASDGFLTCHDSNAGLVVAHVDDRLRRRLALPDLPDLTRVSLPDFLGNRLSAEQRDDLASAVASGQRIALTLEGAGDLRLHLAPTFVQGVWIGALENTAGDREVRIEAAALHSHPVSSSRRAQPSDAAIDTDSSIPPVASILDGVRSLIGIRDSAGRYLLVNAAMAEFYGVLPNAFLGRTPEQLGLPDQVLIEPRTRSEIEPMIARDVELTDATGRHRRFDIAWRHVPSEDERAKYLLEVATETAPDEDVRAGAASVVPAAGLSATGSADGADARLADTQSRLDVVLSGGSLVLIDWDVATDKLAPSAQLAKLLEVDAHAVPGTAAELARFEHPRDKARVQLELNEHLEGESDEYYCEYRLKSAKGRVRWVIASGRVVERSGDGRPLTYLGTLQDVTETLETGQELQRQLARSQEAMRMSDELTREVRQLEAEIREISQREHERLGHDLHDGLGQELTGVSLLLKSLEDAIERDAPQLRARVRSVRDMVEQSIATARALAQGLSPVHLDRDGFAGALEQLAASSETLYGIPVRYTNQRTAALPQELAGAADLFRITQEAVRNAARHSGAGEIRIKLAVDDERLVITVEDDGRGLPHTPSTNGGMGLKIMRYRASIVGASLEIGARDGGGTVVRCSLRHPRENVT
jgi:signal transduction histidine kinase